MALYFIYAAENMYQGLHGMYDYAIEEAESRDDLEAEAIGMSYDVMDSYSDVSWQLHSDAEEEVEFNGYDEEDYDSVLEAALNEKYEDNLYYYIIKLNPQYTAEWYENLIAREGIESIEQYEVEE